MTPGQPQPKFQLTTTPDYRENYANSVQMRVNLWDFFLMFGTINQIATFITTPVFGEVALLGAAIVLIRLLPQGITGRFFRRGM